MSFEILQGGALTSVQDEGRFGWQQYGVTPGGAVDQRSFHLANVLVGNPKEEAALEATFIGPTCRFLEANVIAITGGDMGPCLNGQPCRMYAALRVQEGDVLSFTGLKSGRCCYIAFAGGLDIPEVMGSRSTMLRIGIGGFQGRKLEKGDVLRFRAPRAALANLEERQIAPEQFPGGEVALRVVTGPQDDEFTEEGLRDFFWHGGTITNEFDRLGCRIEREPIPHRGDGNIISDGISFGSIQVPTNGKPIIMLADRASTGGYAKIGTVITVDLPLLAQSRPGQHVRFVRVSLDLAQELLIREQKAIAVLEERFHEAEREHGV